MRRFRALGWLACPVAAGSGCVGPAEPAAEPVPQAPLVAVRTDTPVTVDGVLDEPVWQQAPAYPLQLADDPAVAGDTHFFGLSRGDRRRDCGSQVERKGRPTLFPNPRRSRRCGRRRSTP